MGKDYRGGKGLSYSLNTKRDKERISTSARTKQRYMDYVIDEYDYEYDYEGNYTNQPDSSAKQHEQAQEQVINCVFCMRRIFDTSLVHQLESSANAYKCLPMTKHCKMHGKLCKKCAERHFIDGYLKVERDFIGRRTILGWKDLPHPNGSTERMFDCFIAKCNAKIQVTQLEKVGLLSASDAKLLYATRRKVHSTSGNMSRKARAGPMAQRDSPFYINRYQSSHCEIYITDDEVKGIMNVSRVQRLLHRVKVAQTEINEVLKYEIKKLGYIEHDSRRSCLPEALLRKKIRARKVRALCHRRLSELDYPVPDKSEIEIRLMMNPDSRTPKEA